MPADSSHFRKGTRVTICIDKEGKHPQRIGIVKRIGNGAWRLGGCSEWYSFEGIRVAVDKSGKFTAYDKVTCYARPYQEGDEEKIAAEEAKLTIRQSLLDARFRLESRISGAKTSICYYTLKIGDDERRVRLAKENLEYAEANLQRTKDAIAREEAVLPKLQEEIERVNKEIETFDQTYQQE